MGWQKPQGEPLDTSVLEEQGRQREQEEPPNNPKPEDIDLEKGVGGA